MLSKMNNIKENKIKIYLKIASYGSNIIYYMFISYCISKILSLYFFQHLLILIRHCSFFYFRDVIAGHSTPSFFLSHSFQINLPLEISVGLGTEWSANRRRMILLPLPSFRQEELLSNYSPAWFSFKGSHSNPATRLRALVTD